MDLTKKDRKKIRFEKRIGIAIAALIILFGGFSIFIFTILTVDKNWTLIALISIGIVCFSLLVYYMINHKLNSDLKEGKKIIKVEKIQNKIEEDSYEAGSGSMYIPILASISPKLWGQKMNKSIRYSLIINNTKHYVDEQLYKEFEIGDEIEMFYTIKSDLLLEIKK